MNTRDLSEEMGAARDAMTLAHYDELARHRISTDLSAWYGLVGAARVRVTGGIYQPVPDGDPAYITPIRVYDALSPEALQPDICALILGHLVDLVAWHPRHPSRWALRRDAATWLGCIEPQYLDPPPVHVRRSPLAWLQANCDGLVILNREPAAAYMLLTGLSAIVAEDTEHEAELRRLVQRPWPLPRITAAHREALRHAA